MSWASKPPTPYRIDHGKNFRLKHFDPAATTHVHSKEHAQQLLERGITEMAEFQDKLYAQDRWGVLLMFQAMDAAGKDGVIKHVMSGVNPQGCQVYSFKAPSSEDLNHDYLWRTSRRLPERGHIGIFNRSYYEEVLVVRVHPPILKNERLPDSLIGKDFGRLASQTSLTSNAICRITASSCASFSSTSRRKNKNAASLNVSRIRIKTGSSPLLTSPSVPAGTITCKPTRK